ncbi:Hypothetical protein R9X50_00392900 [Acrodontium crateriforme]|uniref:TFIIS N-terminal domain-containing protein n=1 Tax=Acrodontium crateriforme TaxID=150365 RepID=A0AAQ3R7W5_9PEZI|nr:Hypothetical protein R9X50_00392900 [Acrodontium crateriforme]
MEDLEPAAGSPTVNNGAEPQGNDDNQDPSRPEVEEEAAGDGTPHLAESADDAEENRDDDDGDDSELEELDEKEFEDFDANALDIPNKPVQIDADNVGLLGVHKRKRTEEEERERKKKRKEGRREKPKRSRKNRDAEEDNFEGGVEMQGKRARKDGRAPRRAATPENEDDLSPEERRRRALDRRMDEALKGNRTSRRRAGLDLAAMADEEISIMRQRMAKACEQDLEARARGEVATHKIKILPEVVELLNKNTIQAQLVDPETNILEGVRFMLEPAEQDAALPNYQIQRELFAILGKLNIGKEALVASGIGKVVLFYTKSIQPQPEIKRQAEKLIGDWMRVVLKKDKAMRNKPVETRIYDPIASQAAARAKGPELDRAAIAAEKRRKLLAAPQPANRARVEGGLQTYTIAPINNLSAGAGLDRPQRLGDETFKRIAARGAPKGKRL